MTYCSLVCYINTYMYSLENYVENFHPQISLQKIFQLHIKSLKLSQQGKLLYNEINWGDPRPLFIITWKRGFSSHP